MRWISHAGGVTETSGNFANDTSMSYPEVEAFAEAYERNMETLEKIGIEGWLDLGVGARCPMAHAAKPGAAE